MYETRVPKDYLRASGELEEVDHVLLPVLDVGQHLHSSAVTCVVCSSARNLLGLGRLGGLGCRLLSLLRLLRVLLLGLLGSGLIQFQYNTRPKTVEYLFLLHDGLLVGLHHLLHLDRSSQSLYCGALCGPLQTR